MTLDPSKQYQQGEAQSLGIFDVSNGDIKNVNGRAARVSVNNNGTRSVSDLGDYGMYQQQQQAQQQQRDNEAKATALAATQKANMDQRFATDKQDVGDFTNEYQGMSTGTNNYVMDKYHIPDLVTATNGIDQAIKNLQFNGNGSGADGVMSQSGMNSYLDSTQLPKFGVLSDALARSGQAAGTEFTNLMAPEVAKGTLLNERLAREMTGFTAEQQRELDGLAATIASGTSLTNTEMTNFEALAQAEQGYQNALQVQSLKNQGDLATAQAYNQNYTIGSGQSLYNINRGILASGLTGIPGLGGSSFSGGSGHTQSGGSGNTQTQAPTTNNNNFTVSDAQRQLGISGANSAVIGGNNVSNLGLGSTSGGQNYLDYIRAAMANQNGTGNTLSIGR